MKLNQILCFGLSIGLLILYVLNLKMPWETVDELNPIVKAVRRRIPHKYYYPIASSFVVGCFYVADHVLLTTLALTILSVIIINDSTVYLSYK